MEQEWVSLNEYMRRNHIGYETALKLMSSGKVVSENRWTIQNKSKQRQRSKCNNRKTYKRK